MLGGALIEDTAGRFSGVLDITTPRAVNRKISFTPDASGKGAVFGTSGIKVSEEKAALVLRPASAEEGEYSLVFTGLKYDSGEMEDPAKSITGGRIPVRVSFMRRGEILAENIIQIQTENTPSARGQDDFLISSRWAEKGVDSIVLTFMCPGEYSFDELELYHINETSVNRAMAAYLNGDHVDADLHDEKMALTTGEITVSGRWSKDSIACFSIPVSKGWSCTVDGESREIITVNGMYIGVEVSAGAHDIALEYQCPMKMVGFIATVVGAVLFAAIVTVSMFRRRSRRKLEKAESAPEPYIAPAPCTEPKAEPSPEPYVAPVYEPVHEPDLVWDTASHESPEAAQVPFSKDDEIKLVWDETPLQPPKEEAAAPPEEQDTGIKLVFDEGTDGTGNSE